MAYLNINFNDVGSELIARLDELIDNPTALDDALSVAENSDKLNNTIEQYKNFKSQDDITRFGSDAANQVFSGLSLESYDQGKALLDSKIDGTDYNANLDASQAREDAYTNKYPLTSTAIEMVSSIPPIALGAGLLKKIPQIGGFLAGAVPRNTQLGKAGRIIPPAVIEGGVYGYNSADYSDQNRMKNAAITGALTGAAAPVLSLGLGAFNKVRPVIDNLRNRYARSQGNPTTEDKIVRDALGKVVKIADGKETVIADLDKGIPLSYNRDVVRVVDSNVRDDLPAMNALTKEVYGNKSAEMIGASKDIVDTLKKSTDTNLLPSEDPLTDGLEAATKRLKGDQKKASDILYENAGMNNPISRDSHEDILNFFKNDTFDNLSELTKRKIKSITGRNVNKKLFKLDEKGITLSDGVTLDNLTPDALEKINRILKKSRDENDQEILGAVKGQLFNLLDDKYPDLTKARNNYTRMTRNNDLTDEGKNLFTEKKSDDFFRIVNEINDGANAEENMQFFTRGVLLKINETLKNVKTDGAKKAFFLSLKKEENVLRQMLAKIYPEEDITKIVARIERTNNTFDVADDIGKYAASKSFDNSAANKGFFKKKRISKESLIDGLQDQLSDQDLTAEQKRKIVSLISERNKEIILLNLNDPKYETYIRRILQPLILATVNQIGDKK